MNNLWYLIAIPLSLWVCSASAQQPLIGELTIYQVVEELTDNGAEQYLEPVQVTTSGTLLEYVLTYRNVSNQTLTGFDIRTPIPVNTIYVSGTARHSLPAEFEISVDGGETWSGEPVQTERVDSFGRVEVQEILPESYSHLRWLVDDVVPPGATFDIRYRVRVR